MVGEVTHLSVRTVSDFNPKRFSNTCIKIKEGVIFPIRVIIIRAAYY